MIIIVIIILIIVEWKSGAVSDVTPMSWWRQPPKIRPLTVLV